MPNGLLAGVGIGNSMNIPVGVTRPILLPALVCSVNQRLPSGPAVMAKGPPVAVGTTYSVNIPAGVTFAMRLPTGSLNHRLPPAPAVTPAQPRPLGTPRSGIRLR